MPSVELPSPLLPHTRGERRIEVEGSDVGAVLRALEARHPDLAGWILDERGALREHVNVFVGNAVAGLDTPVAEGDEVHVIQAISGGAREGATGDGDGVELLVGTRKGLFVLAGDRRRGDLEVRGRAFGGQSVEYALRDPRTGRCWASVTHGQFGPHLYATDDPLGDWQEADGPAFPEGSESAVTRIWTVEPGEEEGVLWAGVAPAALFRSADGGRSWELVESLWEHPTRSEWEGGAGGLALHSICPWPGRPERLAVAVSAAGVWLSEDGGASWSRGVEGLVAPYLPEGARRGEATLMHCIHDMKRCPRRPDRLYLQYHGGVYRSDDAGRSWLRVSDGNGLPADFGFPLVVDPADPDRAFVIPLVADVDRVTPEGKMRVYETRDAGATWESASAGLPDREAWLTVLRQAFSDDGGEPLGLWFGAESGQVFGRVDGGEWREAARHLPMVYSVRATATGPADR